MAKVRVEHLSGGYHELVNEPGIEATIRSYAGGVAARAGFGARVRVTQGMSGRGSRPIAFVTCRVPVSTPRQLMALGKALRGAL